MGLRSSLGKKEFGTGQMAFDPITGTGTSPTGGTTPGTFREDPIDPMGMFADPTSEYGKDWMRDKYRGNEGGDPTDPTTPGEDDVPFDITTFLENNPAYQFRLKEGLRGLQRTAAAKGMFGSGNLLRDLTQFSSELASTEWDKEMQRIMAMAGVGEGDPAAAGEQYGVHGSRGVGYEQRGYGSLGGLFDLFQ